MNRPTALAILAAAVAALAAAPPDDFRLQWERPLPRRDAAWTYTPRMSPDRGYEPALAGDLAFVGGVQNGAVLALDAATGAERWRFYTNGPIRVGPVADAERVYVASDDGVLYAVGRDGTLDWSFRGGRSDRKVLAHGRLVSAWPASARPLLHDGRIYYTAGLWPVDTVYLHCLDAATGRRIWTNDSPRYRPFGAVRFAEGMACVDGHHGSGAYDPKTGATLAVKVPKRPGRVEGPATPGVKGSVTAKVVDGDRAIVATNDGRVYGFARRDAEPKVLEIVAGKPAGDRAAARKLLDAANVRAGYVLVAGLTDGKLVEGLIGTPEVHVVAVDPDAEKVRRIRIELDSRSAFDSDRLTVLAGDPELPPYFASLVVSESGAAPAEKLRECLRPHGGAWAVRRGDGWSITRREGPPEGADDWTHEYHDPANTLCSDETLARAPLGVLWYGGAAADTRYYFDGNVDHQSGHGINPQPTPAMIVEGRMFLQGPGVLAGVDIYTGRVLWEAEIPRMYTFGGSGGGLGIHSKKHKEPWRHPKAMEAEVPPTHHPRASGFNMMALPDGVYVGMARNLVRFDPATGKRLSSWPVPVEGDLCWGNLRAVGDRIVATLYRPKDLEDAQAGHDGNGGDWAGDRMPMRHLVGIDRGTGKLLWSREATWGFINRSGVCAGGGKVYAVDVMTQKVMTKLREAGRTLPAEQPRLYALDLETGKVAWSRPLDRYIKNLAYSVEHDILLVPNRNGAAWKDGEWVRQPDSKGRFNKNTPGRMWALRGADGTKLWDIEGKPYHTPPVIRGDMIIDRYGTAYDIRTGDRDRRISPVTGEPEPWSFRKGGCNQLIAGRNLATWRCGFYDLRGQTGAVTLSGMDAGCSPSLLPAGGLVVMPNFGTHHKRNRSTAMALVHRPGNEPWTVYHSSREKAEQSATVPFRRVGYNFGAPGDRKADDGTLWFRVDQRSRAEVKWTPKEVTWLRDTSPAGDSWIADSGVAGATTLSLPVAVTSGKPGPLAKGDRKTFTVRLHLAEFETAGART